MGTVINLTTKFEEGNIYQMTFIGDADLKVPYICVKRTKKMVTLEKFKGKEVLKKKINVYRGVEYIKAGSYSMAPSIYADKIIG